MKSKLSTLLVALGCCISMNAQDVMPDTWVCDDALGRPVLCADDAEVKVYRDKYTMGIFYYLWHGYHQGFNKDISQLIHENPDDPDWDREGYFHWGSKPWFGYYMGGNQYVVAKHMQMLVDAGIDFYFFDATNGHHYENAVNRILAEIDRRTELGLKSPKLCFMVNANQESTVNNIYNSFYANPDNDKYWYYYEDKPLILADPTQVSTHRDDFTFRRSWAWLNGRNPKEWSWLEYYPQKPGWYYKENGNMYNEQLSISVAQHATTKVGKSFHGGSQPAYDKYGLCEETPYGLYFQEQWDRTTSLKTPIVMITQWNEWVAQRFVFKEGATNYGDIRPGATYKVGESYFVDVYNEEFSRDIEPSTSPLILDNYYLQMVSNIRRYRGAHALPVPTANIAVDINGPWAQWDAETTVYGDEPGDCEFTYAKAMPDDAMARKSNDLVKAKVTKDENSIYFYVETADDIILPGDTSTLWMTLLLNIDCDYTTGWGGYDFITARDGDQICLMRNVGNAFQWEKVTPIDSRIEGNRMMLAIDKDDLNIASTEINLDFKWADNTSIAEPDIMRFISDGDAAPNGRFNYRYKGTSLPNSSVDFTTVDSRDPQWALRNAVAIFTPAGVRVAKAERPGLYLLQLPDNTIYKYLLTNN